VGPAELGGPFRRRPSKGYRQSAASSNPLSGRDVPDAVHQMGGVTTVMHGEGGVEADIRLFVTLVRFDPAYFWALPGEPAPARRLSAP
jgi:hypothetical protein